MGLQRHKGARALELCGYDRNAQRSCDISRMLAIMKADGLRSCARVLILRFKVLEEFVLMSQARRNCTRKLAHKLGKGERVTA